MRNLSRHAGPNRMMFLLLIPCLLLSALRAKAEETALPEGKRPGVTLQVEMDLVSSYIWRGVYEAGPSLQPGLTLGIGNFTIAAWGSVDFTSSSYKEADLMLSYRLKNITFHLKDLYDEGSASDRNPQISRNYPAPHRSRHRMAGIAQSPHHALLVHDPFRSAGCRYPGAAVLLLIRRGSLSLYGQNHRPENGRRSRALENGRRRRSQRFCREKRLHKRRKTVGGQKHGFLPNRTLHPSLLVSAQRGHELRRRHFAADVTAKNNREALPSSTEGLLCFVQLHLRTFPLRTRPAKERAYCITSTQFTAKTDFIVP